MTTGSDKKILITGASGFLGGHLTRFLSARNYILRALYHRHKPNAEMLALPGVEWMQCDLLDIYQVETAMDGVSDIYHCAAIVSFDPAQRNEMQHFNIESTVNIVNEALVQHVRKLVYVSSVAALGRSIGDKKITEDEEWEEEGQNTAYGASKYMAEMEVWRGMAEGLNAVVVNPAIILGTGNWDEGSAHLMKVAYKEFPFYTKGTTGWVDVRDVVEIMHLLMCSDVVEERFILSVGNYEYREVFKMMAKALKKRPPYIPAGNGITNMVWRFSAIKSAFSGSRPFITKETARNAQHSSYYNNEKILHFFPHYKYRAITDTIQLMAQSFLQDLKEGN